MVRVRCTQTSKGDGLLPVWQLNWRIFGECTFGAFVSRAVLVSCPIGKIRLVTLGKKLGLQSNFHTFTEEFSHCARQPMKLL